MELYSEAEKTAFVDLLKQIICVHPEKRISPSEALTQRFINMRRMNPMLLQQMMLQPALLLMMQLMKVQSLYPQTKEPVQCVNKKNRQCFLQP